MLGIKQVAQIASYRHAPEPPILHRGKQYIVGLKSERAIKEGKNIDYYIEFLFIRKNGLGHFISFSHGNYTLHMNHSRKHFHITLY